MDTVSNDSDVLVDDEHTRRAIKQLDDALANIARALTGFHGLGVAPNVAIELVKIRADLQWRHNIKDIPTFRQWLDDPEEKKLRGSDRKARASQTEATKFKGKVKRLQKESPVWEINRQYLSLLWDIVISAAKASRGEPAAEEAPTAAPAHAATPATDDIPSVGYLASVLPPLK